MPTTRIPTGGYVPANRGGSIIPSRVTGRPPQAPTSGPAKSAGKSMDYLTQATTGNPPRKRGV